MSPFRRPPRALWVLLGAALAVRLLVIAVDTSFDVLAQPNIALFHHQRVSALVTAWFNGHPTISIAKVTPPAVTTSTMRVLVAYLLAPFYVLFTPIFDFTPIVGRIAITVYSLTLGPLTYLLASELGLTERMSLVASGVTLFWPSVFYRSIVIQREIFVGMVLLVTVLLCARWANSGVNLPESTSVLDHKSTVAIQTAAFAIFAVASATMWFLRPENLLIIGVVVLGSSTIRYYNEIWGLVATAAIMVVGTMVVRIVGFGTFIGGEAYISPSQIDEFAHARAHGSAAYLVWLHYQSWFDIVLFAPVKIVYLLGSPMPWRVNNLTQLLAGVSGWLLLAVTLVAIYGVASVIWVETRVEWQAVAVLATFLIVGIGSYAIIEMNAGAAFRRRTQFVPGIMVLASIGFASIQN